MNPDNHQGVLSPKELKDKKAAEEQEMIKLNKKYSVVITLLQARILCNLLTFEGRSPQGEMVPMKYSLADAEAVIPILNEFKKIAVIETNIPQSTEAVLTGKES